MAGSYAMDQAVSWQAVVFSSIVGETILDYCSLKECNKMQLLSLSTSRWGFVINRMIHWDAPRPHWSTRSTTKDAYFTSMNTDLTVNGVYLNFQIYCMATTTTEAILVIQDAVKHQFYVR